MSNSILGWIIFAIAVTVFLGALRVPRWLIGVLCLLAPFVVPLNFSLNSGNLSASDRQTLMYIGGAFVVVVAPITGFVGFLGACIGKKIADIMGGETPKWCWKNRYEATPKQKGRSHRTAFSPYDD